MCVVNLINLSRTYKSRASVEYIASVSRYIERFALCGYKDAHMCALQMRDRHT